MDTSPTEPSRLPKKRVRKRILIPGIFIGGVAILLLWGTVRGNWADTQPRNPGSGDDGVVSQLLRTGEGHKQIRCAMIVSAPADRVWAAVTDYDHFAEIFPNITASKGVRD